MREVTPAALLDSFYNMPLLLHPARAEAIVAHLRSGGVEELLQYDSGEGLDDLVMPSGVAILNVTGLLLHRIQFSQRVFAMTGCDGIKSNFLEVLNNRDVRGIVLLVDSLGGEARGVFELAEVIYRARGRKPILAIVLDQAVSGGYLIASAADRIVVRPTGEIGGIGFATLIADTSKGPGAVPLKVHALRFGAHRVEGLSTMPFTSAHARFRADLDGMGKRLVETIARNRAISVAAVREMEGAIFVGPEAVRQCLVDAVSDPEASFNEFRKLLDKKSTSLRGVASRLVSRFVR